MLKKAWVELVPEADWVEILWPRMLQRGAPWWVGSSEAMEVRLKVVERLGWLEPSARASWLY